MKLTSILSGVALSITLLGCSSPQVQTGADAERNEHGLVRVNHSRFKDVYIDDQFDFSQYKSYLIKPLDTSKLDVQENRSGSYQIDWTLTDKDREELNITYLQAIEDKLVNEGQLNLVDEIATDTLVIEGHLLKAIPYQDKHTSVQGGSRNKSYSSSPGIMEIAIDVLNPANKRVVAEVRDRREAGRNTGTKEMTYSQQKRDVNYTFRLWADMLKTGLIESQKPR